MGPPYSRNVRTRVAWAIDPSSGARVGTGTLTNKLAIRQSLSTPAGLVLLLGTSGLNARADSQLALVALDGSVKVVTVPPRSITGGRLMSRMAVDSSTNHAYVVAAGAVVFDVDLDSMTITPHDVGPPAGAPDVPAAIGIPDAEILAGKLAISGFFPSAKGGLAQGVALVDVTNWTARTIDRLAARFFVAGDRLLTYGPTSASTVPYRRAYRGVSAYDASGVPIAHLYGNRAVNELFVTPGFGHAVYSGRSTVKQIPKIGPPFVIPNDQLAFNLQTGSPAGGGSLSSAQPPLGATMLIFRGSAMLGEPGDRQPAPSTARPSNSAPSGTATATSTATTTAAAPAPRSTQAARTRGGYKVSNLGRRVTPRGRTRLFDENTKYELYLLGTAGRSAFYRVQVSSHFRCWGSGDAKKIGNVGMLGCPTVVGAYPLQLEDTVLRMSPTSRKPPTYLRIDGLVADGAVKVELRDSSVIPLDAQGNDLKPHPEWGATPTAATVPLWAGATKVLRSRLDQVVQHATARGVDVTVGRNRVVVVKAAALDPETKRRISGRNVGISCFVVSPTIRHTRRAGISFTWDGHAETAFKILGYIKPLSTAATSKAPTATAGATNGAHTAPSRSPSPRAAAATSTTARPPATSRSSSAHATCTASASRPEPH
jgi:hypothetical protein